MNVIVLPIKEESNNKIPVILDGKFFKIQKIDKDKVTARFAVYYKKNKYVHPSKKLKIIDDSVKSGTTASTSSSSKGFQISNQKYAEKLVYLSELLSIPLLEKWYQKLESWDNK